MGEEIIAKIKDEAKKYFENMSPAHDWSHVERVYSLALKIAEKEKANLFVVKLAALLHDIGRKQEMKNPKINDHAKISEELALKILRKYKIDEQTIKQVLHCISSHRFRNNEKPETKEAKVLYDADKLDSIGAIGIARAYAFAGEQKIKLYSDKNFLGTGYEKEHSPVTEFLFKLSKVKDTMQTKTGKLLARERHDFTSNYFEKLNQELKQGS